MASDVTYRLIGGRFAGSTITLPGDGPSEIVLGDVPYRMIVLGGEWLYSWNRRTPSQSRWDDVRDAIEQRLRDEEIGEPYREFADELTTIALAGPGPA